MITETALQKPGKRTSRWKLVLIFAAVIACVGGWWIVREGRPWLDGVEAYIYGFPMVVMDLTREASLAETPGEITAPMNQFAVMSRFPDASFRAVPRTGLDTLFATAWADLGPEPLVLSVPDTGGRYYVIALFDYWSNVFASIGKRTTGTGAKHFLIVGPGWAGATPAGLDGVYRSPTRIVWVNGQMQADGPQECAAVTALQKQYKLTPLSAWGQPYTPPARVPVPAGLDTGMPPVQRIQKMDAGDFFGRLARLMKDNPPAAADGPMLKKLARLGLEPGKDFEIVQADPRIARALNRSMAAFKLLEKGVQKLKTKDGWIVIPKDFANYGTDYLTRAGIAMIGLGGIQPPDVVYPTAFLDAHDKSLDAANRYVLHFGKDQLPPTQATWSVSMYDPDGYYVSNAINRYALSAWMPLKYNADGSLDIYLQTDSPGADKEANWLPAPKQGPFNLTIRVYWPKPEVLDGTWNPPGVKATL
jgi:hypothetical protein